MKRALVTGGSGSIGAAICRRLAAEGMHVIVHAHHHSDKANMLVEQLQQEKKSAQMVQFDVSDTQQTQKILNKLVEEDPIQVVIHNAGIYDDVPLAGMSEEQWHKIISVNLNGFYNVTKPLLLPMMATRWGRIISISSISASMGTRGQCNYAAAKAGLEGATRALATELASRGITVNAIAPGIIQTQKTQQIFSQEFINTHVPMQRAGDPGEVAALANFLVSNEAAYISGQTIALNGAML